MEYFQNNLQIAKKKRKRNKKFTVNVQRDLWRSDIQYADFKWQIFGQNPNKPTGSGYQNVIYSNTPLDPGRDFSSSSYPAGQWNMPGSSQWTNLFKYGVVLGATLQLKISCNLLQANDSNIQKTFIVSVYPVPDSYNTIGVATNDFRPYLNRKGCQYTVIGNAYNKWNTAEFESEICNPTLLGLTEEEWIADQGTWFQPWHGRTSWTDPTKYNSAGWLISVQWTDSTVTGTSANIISTEATVTYHCRLHNYGGGLIPE